MLLLIRKQTYYKGDKMASFIGGIVQLAIGAIMLASVFIATVKGTNTSTWTASEVSLWGVLTLAGIVGLVVGTLQLFGIM